MIFKTIDDWNEEPVITTISSIDAPVTDLLFPTVTVCSDPYKPANPWAFISNVLDLMDYNCGKIKNCKDDSWYEHDFKFLPKVLFQPLSKYVEDHIEIENMTINLDPWPMTNAILNNFTDLPILEEMLLDSFFDSNPGNFLFKINLTVKVPFLS